MEFSVTIKGMDDLMAKVSTIAEGAAIKRYMNRVWMEMLGETQRTVRQDIGTLALSFTANHLTNKGITKMDGAAIPLWGRVGTPMIYGAVLNYGRRPGAKMPPKDALLIYMRRHGIPEELEFVVRRAIGRHGIKADHFFENAVKHTEGKMDEFLETAAKEIEEIWGEVNVR